MPNHTTIGTSSYHRAGPAAARGVLPLSPPVTRRFGLCLIAILVLFSLLTPSPLFASYGPPDSGSALSFNLLLDQAISQHLIAGGVIVTGNRAGILSTAARGRISSESGAAPLDADTVFDLASLTKVVATAPAVMKLLDEGKISLSDPLSRWFPEFARGEGGEITVLNLLTHTSGLKDFDISRKHPMGRAVKRAAAQGYRQWLGKRFEYADINFILLGELVRRVSGQTLDSFCRREIYAPLGAQDTCFLPARESRGDLAPTAGYGCGVVGDGNARRLGSVAGHAGLFSSAADLARFARLMLGRGSIDNRRILSEQVVAQMTAPYLCNNGQVRRGLGWDISSPFSGVKGAFFSEASFGHTGYSGSSIWIDPQQDRFVILLTRRVNYHDSHAFNQLRRDVSTLASADFDSFAGDRGLDQLWELAWVKARLLQPELVILPGAPGAVSLNAQPAQKAQHRLAVQRRSAKAERQLSKPGEGRRLARFARVAKLNKTYKGLPGSRKRLKWQRGDSV
jgi:CubicO group peptidase (beta-lactamase class C family)